MTLCESFHILFIIIDIYYYCLCSNKTRLLFYEYSRYYWIGFLRCGSFGILFLYSSKKRFNYASCMPKPYTGKYDLFDITKFDLYCLCHCLCQGVIFIQFYCTRMKVIGANFRGKVYFIYLFIERKERLHAGLHEGPHHFYVPRYIFHCFTFPSYLLS